jgi:predicted nucleic acid-binding protein
MKPVCCDTSFLVSLYGNDLHTPTAREHVRKLQQPLSITDLNEYEYEQTLRILAWRKLLTVAEVARQLATFNADCTFGRFITARPKLSRVLQGARRLSAKYTITGGHRIFDILLVAMALEVGATHFLTFDANQRKLAQAEKLKVAP